MYTSIPTKEATNILYELLNASNFCYHGITVSDIHALITIILNNFGGIYYKQMRGLPMGSKISSIMADVFMQWIEKPIIRQLSMLYYTTDTWTNV